MCESESRTKALALPVSADLHLQFGDHVKSSCLRPFPSLYFAVGLVEEVAELAEELEQEKGQEQKSHEQEAIEGELGDTLWYLYALCNTLEGVEPCLPPPPCLLNNPLSSSSSSSCLLALVGSLCGSLKKWSRGDKGWQEFKDRIQKQVSSLLLLLASLGDVEEAMRNNIAKIQGRRERGTLRGDGSNR